MPQPVTTAELLLQEVVDLLVEIRGLLQAPPAADTSEKSAIAEPAPRRAPAKKTTARQTVAKK